MAGHSKWANIKHKKAKEDSKKGKIFTKLIREIVVAAKLGGGDKDSNPRLRAAVANALSNNMTKDTVERAIKKGAGDGDGGNVEEIRYEGYAPGGIAIIVDCMTDNRNRTAAEVRHAFTKRNGNLGAIGSVAYMFDKKGIITFDAENTSEEALMDVALDLGVEDVISYDDAFEIITNPRDFFHIKEALEKQGFSPVNAEVVFDAENKTALDDDAMEKVMGLVDMLEDLDDVQNVYTNIDFS